MAYAISQRKYQKRRRVLLKMLGLPSTETRGLKWLNEQLAATNKAAPDAQNLGVIGKPNIFTRLGLKVEPQADGREKAYCEECAWTTTGPHRSAIVAMARHYRNEHPELAGSRKVRARAEQTLALVKSEPALAEVVMRQNEPNQRESITDLFCPNCSKPQKNISRAYQAAGIAGQLGYLPPNGKHSSGSIRYCMYCGFDLLPGVRTMQHT